MHKVLKGQLRVRTYDGAVIIEGTWDPFKLLA